jgi:SAM-dependent methyltransferase
VSGAAYPEDLAYIHHVGFGGFARAEARRLTTLLKGRKRIVELGCGGGTVARALTERGHEVLGIDASSAFIRLAKRTAPKAKFRVGSFTGQIPPADAVIAIGEVFNYGRHALLPVFRRIHGALPKGGLFIFDFAGPGRGGRETTRGWWAGHDWAILQVRSEKNRLLTRTMTLFRKVGRTYRRSDETHEQTLYTPRQMRALLKAAGFTVRMRPPHTRSYYALIAQK